MPFNQESKRPSDPRKALMVMRILWAAILMGMVVYAGVVTAIKPQPETDPDSLDLYSKLFYINCGLLFFGLIVGYMTRNQFYKRHWEGEVVMPQGYFKGNLVLWAIAEGNAFFSITLVLMAGTFEPFIWPAAAAAVSILLNFPTGHIMFPPRDHVA